MTVGRPKGPTDLEDRDGAASAAEDRAETGEKKQRWPWGPVTSGTWWIEALASRALREERVQASKTMFRGWERLRKEPSGPGS